MTGHLLKTERELLLTEEKPVERQEERKDKKMFMMPSEAHNEARSALRYSKSIKRFISTS